MRPRRYTDDQLIAILRATAHELGRVPTQQEIRPAYATYVARFGTWKNAVRRAGLTPRRQGGDVRYALAGSFDERAAEITARKKAYWFCVERSETPQSPAGPTWVHPYARRSA